MEPVEATTGKATGGRGPRSVAIAFVRSDLWIPALALVLAKLTMFQATAAVGDPMTWSRWGREIGVGGFSLDLTNVTTSWKPLPVAFTTVYGFFGQSAPNLWLLTARAGAIAAVILGFRVAAKLVDDPRDERPTSRWPAVLGGLLSSVLIAWILIPFSWQGFSEGLTVALLLGCFDQMLKGRHGVALVLGWASCLGRPEPVLIVGAYSAWVWRRESRLRPAVLGLPLMVVLLWLVPDRLGSGEWLHAGSLLESVQLDSSGRSTHDPADDSALSVFAKAFSGLPLIALLTLPLGGLAVIGDLRSGRRAAGLLAVGAVVTAAVCAVLVARAGPGLTAGGVLRYLIVPQSLLAVVCGFGVGSAFALAWAASVRLDAAARPAQALLAAAGLILVSWFSLASVAPLVDRAQEVQAYHRLMYKDLERLIAAAGGPRPVLRCGPLVGNRTSIAKFLWLLDSNGSALSKRGGPDDPYSRLPFDHGTTIRLDREDAGDGRWDPIAPGAVRIAGYGPWSIWQRCPRPS